MTLVQLHGRNINVPSLILVCLSFLYVSQESQDNLLAVFDPIIT